MGFDMDMVGASASVDDGLDACAYCFMSALNDLLSLSKITSREIASKANVQTHKIKGLRYGRIKPTLSWCAIVYSAYREIIDGREGKSAE